MLKKVLTIAGSDSGGGAGIQADIKTMIANGVFAMSAITALTAQNTLGVSEILETGAEFLKKQLVSVFDDLYPDAVKTGMLPSEAEVCVVADVLVKYGAKNIVVDPVMVSTAGSSLSSDSAVDAMKKKLFPVADLITPNIPEAEVLSGMNITDKRTMEKAALFIGDVFGCNVLLKGGHSIKDSSDVLCCDGELKWICAERINNPNTHGTGCTLSSAIASNLAKGMNIYDAVVLAKEYISGALGALLDIGSGNGPLNHGFDLKSRYI